MKGLLRLVSRNDESLAALDEVPDVLVPEKNFGNLPFNTAGRRVSAWLYLFLE